jgi:hypothetical protein
VDAVTCGLNPETAMVVRRLVFVRKGGFPRRWSAVRPLALHEVGIITQEHERDSQGKSVFRYRAVLLHRDLGLFSTLRGAKQALTEALDF